MPNMNGRFRQGRDVAQYFPAFLRTEESKDAYVRDEDADNLPVNFKKADKIRAWKLFLNTMRGTSIKAARNSALNMRKRGRL